VIIFLYKTKKSHYNKQIEPMENDMLQPKDPFPKTVTDACGIRSGCKNKNGNSYTRLTEANERVAFATTGTKENNGNKKKEINCYKCNKTSQYANKCKEDE